MRRSLFAAVAFASALVTASPALAGTIRFPEKPGAAFTIEVAILRTHHARAAGEYARDLALEATTLARMSEVTAIEAIAASAWLELSVLTLSPSMCAAFVCTPSHRSSAALRRERSKRCTSLWRLKLASRSGDAPGRSG